MSVTRYDSGGAAALNAAPRRSRPMLSTVVVVRVVGRRYSARYRFRGLSSLTV